MRILTIQNKKEEKFLRRKIKDFDFSSFDKKRIKELIEEMKKTMRAAQGVGLSANQVGLDFKTFVAELPSEKGAAKFYALFNPKIEKVSKKEIVMEEGCLSVPKIYGKVSRPEKIVFSAFDRNGKKVKIKAWGFLARVFQHEMDHLNGALIIDKAKELRRITNDK